MSLFASLTEIMNTFGCYEQGDAHDVMLVSNCEVDVFVVFVRFV